MCKELAINCCCKIVGFPFLIIIIKSITLHSLCLLVKLCACICLCTSNNNRLFEMLIDLWLCLWSINTTDWSNLSPLLNCCICICRGLNPSKFKRKKRNCVLATIFDSFSFQNTWWNTTYEKIFDGASDEDPNWNGIFD